MISLKRVLILGVVAPMLGFASVACSDEATSENSAQSDIDTLSAQVRDNEVLFTIKAIGDLELHELDEQIQAGDIGDSTLPNARNALRYLALTDWPDSLTEEAATVQDAATRLVAALDDGDADAAKQPATDLHEGWHDFSGKAWAAIGEDLPPEAGIDDEHDAAEESPHDAETPAH